MAVEISSNRSSLSFYIFPIEQILLLCLSDGKMTVTIFEDYSLVICCKMKSCSWIYMSFLVKRLLLLVL